MSINELMFSWYYHLEALRPYLFALFAAGVTGLLYNRFVLPSLGDIPGPPSESFWLGNLGQLLRGELGRWDLPWQEQFGTVFRFKACFGENRLWISDPKALQYILNTSSYRFIKPHEARWQLATASGYGLNSSEGPDHQRQRRVLLPAFGASETKSLMPYFRNAVQELVTQWKEELVTEKDLSRVYDLPTQLGNATLDALGNGAFEYDFGALRHQNNALTKSLLSFGSVGFAGASDGKIFSQGIMASMPMFMLNAFLYFPSEGLAFLKKHVDLCNSVAQTLIASKMKSFEAGEVKKDVLSLILKSNISTEAKYRLPNEEIIPQLSTMLVAGHETTTSTIGWILFALSEYPDVQRRLREEIMQVRAVAQAKGSDEPSLADIDAMPYFNAVIKETFRFETVVPHIFREATQTDVIPLSKPIKTRSGKMINELCIPKGTRIIISIIGYNRLQEIWGQDVDRFRPERWLDGTIDTASVNVGVTGNLMTFGSGHRGCIGWRFSYVEIQAFLFELIANFEFSHTDGSRKISRQCNLAMRSMVEGEFEKGNQMPLRVSLAN